MLIFNPFFELTNIRLEWQEYQEQTFDTQTNTLWKEEIIQQLTINFHFKPFVSPCGKY